MSHAILLHQTGNSDVLQLQEVAVGEPGHGQLRIKQTACGLNYIDTYHRSGLYPLPLPAIIGMEGAGVVEAIGAGVTNFTIGDRVAYGTELGGYADMRLIEAERVVKLPDNIDDQTAAAMMLQGMTAEYLIRRTFTVQAGQTVLFHAVAGGVGLIACQWLRHLGATVIGTVGSEEKAAIAQAHGCHHVINYRNDDFVSAVREITGDRGVSVVYDGVGKDTWQGSLDCLQKRGMMVSFGNASGAVPAFDPLALSSKGSLYLTRPKLMDYTNTAEELANSAAALIDVVSAGVVTIEIPQTYPLAEASQAHRDLESRKTAGSTVLIP